MNLVLKDLPEDLLANLSRRAKASGQTVEHEAVTLLYDSFGTAPQGPPNEPFAAALSRRILDVGLTTEDWREFDASLDAARASRSDSIHRWIDFDSADYGT